MSETPAPDHTTELLEELLEHTSQLALRLGHVDEVVQEVKQHVEVLHGQLATQGEVANAALSAATAPKRSGPPSGPIHNDQLDTIERHARSAVSRANVLTALVVVQMLIIGGLAVLAFKPAAPMPEPVAAAHTAPAPAPVAVEKPIENPFAGAPDAPGAAKAAADDDAKSEPKAAAKKKKKK